MFFIIILKIFLKNINIFKNSKYDIVYNIICLLKIININLNFKLLKYILYYVFLLLKEVL